MESDMHTPNPPPTLQKYSTLFQKMREKHMPKKIRFFIVSHTFQMIRRINEKSKKKKLEKICRIFFSRFLRIMKRIQNIKIEIGAKLNLLSISVVKKSLFQKLKIL